jgi:hypothetical protein
VDRRYDQLAIELSNQDFAVPIKEALLAAYREGIQRGQETK